MGCSFDTLKNTIDVYNRSVASGNDEEFGRRFMKGQFLSGPFYLFKCTPVVGITIGGLKVNQRMQVLNEYGEPISKLFAAGEIVGGLHGTSYLSLTPKSLGPQSAFGFN
jgi:succinate dehydrogenase/fumarate reductase flavoprotein subunit